MAVSFVDRDSAIRHHLAEETDGWSSARLRSVRSASSPELARVDGLERRSPTANILARRGVDFLRREVLGTQELVITPTAAMNSHSSGA